MGSLENKKLENKKLEDNNTVVTSFTGAYGKQGFYEDLGAVWLDLRDTQSTSCYCDGGVEAAIKGRIRPMGPFGTHLLDSGNYHYVSKIWLGRVERGFESSMFDHHTDMRISIFGNILSYGDWIQATLDTDTGLKRVYLAGPSCMEAEVDGKRVVGINEGEPKVPGRISRHMGDPGLPFCISPDRDTLNRSCVVTNWDQGETQLEDVLAYIKETVPYRRIVGIDIYGEGPE